MRFCALGRLVVHTLGGWTRPVERGACPRRATAALILACGLASSAPSAMAAARADEPVEAPVPAQVQRHRLAYRFSPGETVHYDSRHTTTFTTRKGMISETAYNESKTRKHYRVVSVAADGSATLELTLDHVQMSARFGDAPPLSLDTARPGDPPPPYRGVVKSVGRPLARLQVSPAGKLLKSESLLPRDVEAAVSGLPAAAAAPDDDPGRNFLVTFPEHALAVGETWSETFSVPVNVTRTLTRDVRLLRKYTLREVDGQTARIAVDMVVVTPLRDPAIRAQLIQREPSGTIEFDLARGVIVSRESTIDKTVVGPFGNDTSMHAESRLTETLVEGDHVARRPGR